MKAEIAYSIGRRILLSGICAAASVQMYGCGFLTGLPCVTQPIDQSLQSGIRGTVTLGPTCPVEMPGQSCVEPYQADLRIECPNGSTVTTVRSDSEGRFEVKLPPGDYTVVPLDADPQSPLPTASTVDVTVPANEFSELQVQYDTGIR
ncbi:MAG: hypothetical protein HY287_04155 [Planctomycetes bacterium]|nr:hypothetical protein [Planctomycetota bacterium]MBI3833506.1 hypothetical protein [Planctomycetota bacterium]